MKWRFESAAFQHPGLKSPRRPSTGPDLRTNGGGGQRDVRHREKVGFQEKTHKIPTMFFGLFLHQSHNDSPSTHADQPDLTAIQRMTRNIQFTHTHTHTHVSGTDCRNGKRPLEGHAAVL